MRRTYRRLVLAMLWLPAVAAHAVEPGPTEPKTGHVWMKAVATLSSEGQVTALRWIERRPALLSLTDALDARVRAWQFEPGTRDGSPAETETPLLLKVALSPLPNEALALRIVGVRTGAIGVDTPPPAYPVEAARAGSEARVVTEIEIAADGRITVVDATYSGSHAGHAYRKRFLDAARNAALSWTYEVERVGGQAVPARLSVPITFCLEGEPSWCDTQLTQSSVADAATPPHEAVALHSVARLKTDPSDPEI